MHSDSPLSPLSPVQPITDQVIQTTPEQWAALGIDSAARLDLDPTSEALDAYRLSMHGKPIDRVLSLRDLKAAAEAFVKTVKDEIKVADGELLEYFAEETIDKVRQADTGRGAHIVRKTRANITVDKVAAARPALVAAGAGDLVKPTVNANTLSSWVKGLIEKARDEASDQATLDALDENLSLALPESLRPFITVTELTEVGTSKPRG
jgi:hypothetical protein